MKIDQRLLKKGRIIILKTGEEAEILSGTPAKGYNVSTNGMTEIVTISEIKSALKLKPGREPKYNEKTTIVSKRVPVSQEQNVHNLVDNYLKPFEI